MASGTQQHQQQQHHHQQQQQQQHLVQHQQNHPMQFTPNNSGHGQTNYDPQREQMQQQSTISPDAPSQIPTNSPQGHMISINHHQEQHQTQLMGCVLGPNMIAQPNRNQLTNHMQLQHLQQQKSQILPLLLSPRPSSLTPNSNDQTEQSENDHDQIIDQVISLENDFSDTSGLMANVDGNAGLMLNHQQHQLNSMSLEGCNFIHDIDPFSVNKSSDETEDMINLLLELDKEPSNLTGLVNSQQLDQDERVGIENIRKQLMSCEVQSELQHQNSNSMSPIVNQMTYQPRVTQQRNSAHQQQLTPQLTSQNAPVIPPHQQSHQSTSSLTQQHQKMSSDQSTSHGSYSSLPMNAVPVSSSGQSYTTQQSQHAGRISQSNPMPIVNNSPSPSWQQSQLSPYSPQNPHNNSRTPSQRQAQQNHSIHQQQHSLQSHPTTTSPQMQQLHHPLQQRSPSQSVSPPVTTELSPVVKKNPLLNAQLVNSRTPSITPTRFINSQTNVMNQNPILNAKLSQSSFVTSGSGSSSVTGSPINPSLNSQSRYIQQSSFNYDMAAQPRQQQNAQQHSGPQSGHATMYKSNDQQHHHGQQQSTNQIFRAASSSINATGGSSLSASNTSPSGNFSQQVKQEIRRKVQQPKQQHQTTSLLKQLLSDDK